MHPTCATAAPCLQPDPPSRASGIAGEHGPLVAKLQDNLPLEGAKGAANMLVLVPGLVMLVAVCLGPFVAASAPLAKAAAQPDLCYVLLDRDPLEVGLVKFWSVSC